jgi:hypothetical protein
MAQHHDSHDSLNDYLDSLVGAKPATSRPAGLDPATQADVDTFFDLARRADMLNTGRSPMNATIGNARAASNSTPHVWDAPARIAMPGRTLNTWLSAAIVLLMLLGIVGGAWWFGPGQGGPSDEPLRLAAITDGESTPLAFWPEPLSPEEAPWIASISPEECTAEPLPYSEYTEATSTDPGPPDGSYEIVGVPEPDVAQEVVTTLRGWLACGDLGQTTRIRSYYTDRLLFYSDFSAPYRNELDQWRAEAQQEWTTWAHDTGLYPLSVVEGIEPPEQAVKIYEFAQAVLDGEATYISPDQTPITYFEARFDPGDAVLLADGRIMIPSRYVYWVQDPWGQKYGFALEPNMQSRAIVLEQVDGQWKIDDSLTWICFGECENPPTSMPATPIATP